MATNVDKALTTAPQGLEALVPDAEIEIEIELPSEEDDEAGSDDEPVQVRSFDENLVEVEGVDCDAVVSELAEAITNDLSSRTDWEKAYKEGLKLMGLQYEERTEPWAGASGVFHPMITEAVVRFQSETITEMFPAQGPVRTKIIGEETPAKKEAATRVENDMNYELTEVMQEFRPEQERMLWNLPAAGSAFKKVYFDPNLDRQVSVFFPAEDGIIPYGVSDLNTCYRFTHVMRKTKNEILRLQRAGFYAEVDLPDPVSSTTDIQQAKDKETGFSDLNDDRYVVYECHADLVIPGAETSADAEDEDDDDRIALPYVVTFLKDSKTVLAVRRNWLEDDIKKMKRQHFVHYQYIPGFGSYGFGLFHLIGGFAKSATSIMRQLVDAGTLSNLPGGLKSRGLRIKGDDTPISPGEFRDVDIGSGALRDNILPLPYKEPSAVLSALLDKIVEEGRRFAATADMQVSDMSAQAPVGTTLALLERQLKVMSAVQARLHYAFKQELKLLAGILRDYTDDSYDYDPGENTRNAKKSDYDMVEIIPVSDPNAATMSQRVVQYQAVMQMAQSAPDIYNVPQLHRNMLEVLGVKHADKLVPLPEDMKPVDPVAENMSVLRGEPVKAFQYQDHKAHMTVHQLMMQDPTVMQAIGQNPKAPMIMGALQAHIAEHTAYMYRQQIEAQLGMALPPEGKELPPQIEMALSGMQAQAAQQALQLNQQQAQQAQAQQQAQDPLVQMQQQELQLKQQEVQLKQQEVQIKQQDLQIKQAAQQTDAQLKQQRLLLDKQTAMSKMAMEGQKLQVEAAARVDELQLKESAIKAQNDLTKAKEAMAQRRAEAQLSSQDRQAGLKIGAEIAKNKAKMELEARTAALEHAKDDKQREDAAYGE